MNNILCKTVIIMLLLATLVSSSAFADTTYEYIGKTVNDTSPSFSSCRGVCFLSGSFTTNSQLQNNQPFEDITPLSFSFNMAGIIIDSANASLSGFEVSTTSSGLISNWGFELVVGQQGIGASTIIQSVGDNGTFVDEVAKYINGSVVGYAETINNPGTWTVSGSTTPVPGPIAGLGLPALLGLLGFGAIRLRRIRSG